MRKLDIKKTTIDNPFLGLYLLEFMTIEKFNQIFKLEKEELHTFMAFCLINGHNFDLVISEETNLGLHKADRFTRRKRWNWKKK